MSDLISREDVLKILEDTTYNREIPKNHGTLLDITKAVNELPVAYDVDKVVEQLEKIPYNYLSGYPHCCEYDYGREDGAKNSIENAIEIVRKGGVE